MTTTSAPDVRVPRPTAVFWTLKVLTTGMGEALSDFLVTRFDPVPVVLITAALFAAALVLQFRARRYVPWRYWFAVSMVGIFGTMVADVVHVVLGVPYPVSTAVFALLLAAVFVLWRVSEPTLDIHSITTFRREAFYWAAVIATFAAGTAAGDFVAGSFGLGYLTAGLLFAAAMAVILVLRGFRAIGPVLAFWAAYVLTRPLGASIADWMAVPPARGGLGIGSGVVGVAALVLIVVGVGIVSAATARPLATDAEARRPTEA